jgi:hypothetical protein
MPTTVPLLNLIHPVHAKLLGWSNQERLNQHGRSMYHGTKDPTRFW